MLGSTSNPDWAESQVRYMLYCWKMPQIQTEQNLTGKICHTAGKYLKSRLGRIMGGQSRYCWDICLTAGKCLRSRLSIIISPVRYAILLGSTSNLDWAESQVRYTLLLDIISYLDWAESLLRYALLLDISSNLDWAESQVRYIYMPYYWAIPQIKTEHNHR